LRTTPADTLSIEGVAKAAGVARSTVYEIFGSRVGLFDAAARDVYDRTGYADLLIATRHEDALEHLRGGITAATRMQARERDVYRALYSMHYLDPDSVGGVVAGIDAERTEGMRRLAARLHEQGYLAEGLSQGVAAHYLWVITSFESFDALHSGRGLSVARSAELLVGMAERAVTNIHVQAPS
jgi:AcrR family transcriptional regulator